MVPIYTVSITIAAPYVASRPWHLNNNYRTAYATRLPIVICRYGPDSVSHYFPFHIILIESNRIESNHIKLPPGKDTHHETSNITPLTGLPFHLLRPPPPSTPPSSSASGTGRSATRRLSTTSWALRSSMLGNPSGGSEGDETPDCAAAFPKLTHCHAVILSS
jgi:hypothetical protein